MVRLLIIYCAFLSSSCQRQLLLIKDPNNNVSANNCLDLLKEYKYYWIADSLGKNGFRHLLGEKLLNACKFSGTKWSVISEYLGKPNYTDNYDNFVHYRYRLNNFTENLGAPGNLFLEVLVTNGIIKSFTIKLVDG